MADYEFLTIKEILYEYAKQEKGVERLCNTLRYLELRGLWDTSIYNQFAEIYSKLVDEVTKDLLKSSA